MTSLFHCVELHEDTDPSTIDRKARARASWETLYRGGVIPVHVPCKALERDARGIGDARNLPYLKEVISQAIHWEKIGDDDPVMLRFPEAIIFLTNDDDILHPRLPDFLRMFIAIHDCATSFRMDFPPGKLPKLELAPEDISVRGTHHMGRDLIAGTAKWFTENWDEIPDYILGSPLWDLGMAALVRSKKGYAMTRENMATVIPCCELPLGLVIHETHPQTWQLLNNPPSERHNRACFDQWRDIHTPQLRI